ncbi:unnamed protein product [Mycena citricolor]|uniref:Uncharacterized protein n=1 Tax=Mycena citricolor TaxID=2018698 RepID=A0AAD2K8R2_9AGAR|nr:unnamed protein product [Mycena citricolor]CAK5282631.1 unnamed protein product [Mycena citricolor]
MTSEYSKRHLLLHCVLTPRATVTRSTVQRPNLGPLTHMESTHSAISCTRSSLLLCRPAKKLLTTIAISFAITSTLLCCLLVYLQNRSVRTGPSGSIDNAPLLDRLERVLLSDIFLVTAAISIVVFAVSELWETSRRRVRLGRTEEEASGGRTWETHSPERRKCNGQELS